MVYCALLFLPHKKVSTLNMQVDAQNQVVRRLEEKERLLQSSIAAAEKELMLRQQAMEMHKRKAIESAQSAADLKLHLGNSTHLTSSPYIHLELIFRGTKVPGLHQNQFLTLRLH